MLNIKTKFDTSQIRGKQEFLNEQTHVKHSAGKDVTIRKY